MNKFLFREKDRALEVEKRGFIGKYIKSDIHTLFKYYKSIDLPKAEAKLKVRELYKKTVLGSGVSDYSELLLKSICDKAYSRDSRLVQVEDVQIYKEELDYISGLDIKYGSKKILFTFLVYKKIENKMSNGNCNMNYFSDGDYKRTCFKDMYGSSMKLDETVFELSKVGLLQNGYNSDIKLLFMDNLEDLEKTDVVYTINMFEKCALYFDMYNDRGGKIKPCVRCEILFKPKSNSAKYCKDCAKVIKNDQNKGYYYENKR